MAKMFYTLEEVAQKLNKSEDEVREMAKSGQIQEFRDREKLMFKVEQIDLLAGGDEEQDEDGGEIPLALEDSDLGGSDLGGSAVDDTSETSKETDTTQTSDSPKPAPTDQSDQGDVDLSDADTDKAGMGDSGLELQDSDMNMNMSDSREGTGVSVFDTDHGGEDASDQTQATDDEDMSLEAVGSGSGLLDLTRESDETTLGAELLEEVYTSDENVEVPSHASGLFEASGAESPDMTAAEPAGGGGMTTMVYEAYDGSGSGLGVGLMIGAMVALICVAIIGIVAVSGATPQLAEMMTETSTSLMIWAGGLLALTIISGLVGMFIGRASE